MRLVLGIIGYFQVLFGWSITKMVIELKNIFLFNRCYLCRAHGYLSVF